MIISKDPFRFRDSGNGPTKSTPMVCHGRVGTSSGTGIAESLDISIHRFPPDIVSETAIPNVDVSGSSPYCPLIRLWMSRDGSPEFTTSGNVIGSSVRISDATVSLGASGLFPVSNEVFWVLDSPSRGPDGFDTFRITRLAFGNASRAVRFEAPRNIGLPV
ncbi:hypothetical protein PILCRDRAFT_91778 [Piloderma croceum F 1598]|uniref:Uncharacterized protein n=1 Tax=Piloderma croceum (strain F 1598) TaxID=765440 RepID=A0A0C3F800_PILCF|nr:hypothetical protein PILCRDRAFT_91778 [Piloderma croceum F 1598]